LFSILISKIKNFIWY